MTYAIDLPALPQDLEFCHTYTPGEAPVCVTCDYEEEDHPEYGDLAEITDLHGFVLRMYGSVNGGVVLIAYEHPERYAYMERQYGRRRRMAAVSANTPREGVAAIIEQIMVGT